MSRKTSVSINILRDSNREMDYFPTPNAIRVVDEISNYFENGNRSF